VTGPDLLHEILLESRDLGFLGPGPVEVHLEHALGFAAAVEADHEAPPQDFVDLGTGGGVPGLVLAARWGATAACFVEANARRCAALRTWATRLGIGSRVTVLEGRAEVFAHDEAWRGRTTTVTARGFSGPAPTAEIAAGFLAPGGRLVVSEPPEPDPGRWPQTGLAELGLEVTAEVHHHGGHFVVVEKRAATPERYPRGVGRPEKRPLW
jgi:16S rRNA (guanine527-N7)-methyltransferase